MRITRTFAPRKKTRLKEPAGACSAAVNAALNGPPASAIVREPNAESPDKNQPQNNERPYNPPLQVGVQVGGRVNK